MLLTAQRRNEVGQLEWPELDLDRRIWTIPAEKAKNGKVHIVHLSSTTVEIIKSLPQINGSNYVFTTAGESAVTGWSASKAALDKQAKLKSEEIERLQAEVAADEAALHDPDLYRRDPERFARLTERIARNRAEIEGAEYRWLEVAELAEQLNS